MAHNHNRRMSENLRMLACRRNGGSGGGGGDPPQPYTLAAQEMQERMLREEIEEKVRNEIQQCPNCGGAALNRVPRAPSVLGNMLAIFVGLMFPPPLNIVLAIWGVRSILTPYWVWYCPICAWEGQSLRGSWAAKFLLKIACFSFIILAIIGWLHRKGVF